MRLALEGKQNKEISEILGIAVTTVKTLKYNALKMLKNSLKGYFPVLLYIYSGKIKMIPIHPLQSLCVLRTES